MNFLSNITIRTKVLSIVLALTLPILYLSYLYVSENLTAIEHKQLELTGLDYQDKLRPLLKTIAAHRGTTASYLSGDESFKEKIDMAGANVDQGMRELNEYHEQWMHVFNTEEVMKSINDDWTSLKSENLNLRKRENFDRHSVLIKKVQKYLNQIAYESGLKTDANPTTSYLVQLTTVNLPSVLEELGKIRGLISSIATRQYLEDGENSTVLAYQMSVKGSIDAFDETLEGVFLENSAIKTLFEERLKTFDTKSDQYMQKIDTLMKDVMVLMTANGQEYFAEGTEVIGVGFDFYSDALLQIRTK